MGITAPNLTGSTPDKVVHLGGSGGNTMVASGSGGLGAGLLGGARGPHAEAQLSEEHARQLIMTGGQGRTPVHAGFTQHSSGMTSSHRPLLSCAVEDFLSERDSLALTPHGGAVLFIHALLNYVQPSMRAAGQQMMVRQSKGGACLRCCTLRRAQQQANHP